MGIKTLHFSLDLSTSEIIRMCIDKIKSIPSRYFFLSISYITSFDIAGF